MYIIKNAFKCIGRSRGRNILIGVIVFVIAVSACIGLSIRQAAENAKSETLEGLTITATISFDRQKAMNDMISGDKNGDSSEGGRPSFDRDKFAGFMGESSSLTLDEYKKYAEAESVKDFYYSVSASFNGNDDFLPVSNDASSGDDTSATTESNRRPNGFFSRPMIKEVR